MAPIAAHSISDITLLGNSHSSCELTATYYNGDDDTTTEAVCSFKKNSQDVSDEYTCAVGTGNFDDSSSWLTIKVSEHKLDACKENGGAQVSAIETTAGVLDDWDHLSYNGTCTSKYFSNKNNGKWGTFSLLKPTHGTLTETMVTPNQGLGSTTIEYYEGMNGVSFYTKNRDLIYCTVWNSWAEKGRFNRDQVGKGFKFESKKYPGRYLQHNTFSESPASLDSTGNTWWIGDENSVCPKDGDTVFLAKSEDNDNEWSDGYHEQYLRIQDNDTDTTNVDQDYVGSLEKWKLEIVTAASAYNDCLLDGDEIRLKSVETGLYMRASSETGIAIDEDEGHSSWDRVKFYAHASDYIPPTYAYAQKRTAVGGDGGSWFDTGDIAQEALDGSIRVSKIHLNSGNRVDTLGFTYSDDTEVFKGNTSPLGVNQQWNQTYHLAEGEYVKYARACVDRKNGSDRIFYLELKTSFGNSIAGGTESGTCTQFKESVAGDGSVLISIRGRAGAELDKIGFWQMIP